MFEGAHSPPLYNNLYNFKDGPQNDIFETNSICRRRNADQEETASNATSAKYVSARVLPFEMTFDTTIRSSAPRMARRHVRVGSHQVGL